MHLRAAVVADIPVIRELIEASARGLNDARYSPAELDAAVTHVFGVDTQLIADGSYFVIEDGATLAAAGGWSARRTLYGGDQMKGSADPLLDPAVDPARIRAFFVHPAHARKGLARRLYDACALAAWNAGYRSLELMSTLPGVPFYLALGFVEVERVSAPQPNGVAVPFVRMLKPLQEKP